MAVGLLDHLRAVDRPDVADLVPLELLIFTVRAGYARGRPVSRVVPVLGEDFVDGASGDSGETLGWRPRST